MMDLNSRAIGPVVGQLKRLCDGPKESELERLFNKLPHLDQRARHEIRRSFDRLANKIFHPTLESLRMESRTEVPTKLLDAMKRLFQFKD
jgi:glutamyl-tRNA reductase